MSRSSHWMGLGLGTVLAAAATPADARPSKPAAALEAAKPPVVDDTVRAQRAAIVREEPLKQMAFWADQSMRFPDDVEAQHHFTESLRRSGRLERAIEVGRQALLRFPDDAPLMRSFGLSLAQAGRAQEALRPLALVAASDPADWGARSALGVALDQLDRHGDARRAYEEALAIVPQDAGVLTNYGVSFLLTGELAEAEKRLRQAASAPGADDVARQNLALAIGLQGRFAEAEEIAKIDLGPEAAAANTAYLRALLSDGRSWRDLKSGG
jgi:Flp pilus assembly protein TadD